MGRSKAWLLHRATSSPNTSLMEFANSLSTSLRPTKKCRSSLGQCTHASLPIPQANGYPTTVWIKFLKKGTKAKPETAGFYPRLWCLQPQVPSWALPTAGIAGPFSMKRECSIFWGYWEMVILWNRSHLTAMRNPWQQFSAVIASLTDPALCKWHLLHLLLLGNSCNDYLQK